MDGDGADVPAGVDNGSWRTWTRRPAAALRGIVRSYHGFVVDSGVPSTDRVLPAPTVTVILSFGDRLRLEASPGSNHRDGSFVSFFAGLDDRPGVIAHDGHQAGVQLDLDPLGAALLLGAPVGGLARDVVALDALLGPDATRLTDRLAEVPDWPARFALLDTVLTAGLDQRRAPAPEIRHAWRRIRHSGGRVRVDELAAETGWSRRHLSERFRRELGLTPKTAARVARFDRARWLLLTGPRTTLTDLAVRCGFYDHAHMAREFRVLAGCPPAELAKLPFVQDP
ncbi:MAG TPA: helix-turn-helix domain-containing protein [Streptosporangiales bacterium]